MTVFELSPTELTTLALILGIKISNSYTIEELEVLVSVLEILIGILDLVIVSNEKALDEHTEFTPRN